jgi:hypothetical protein
MSEPAKPDDIASARARRVQVALAEFNALRGEIDAHSKTQDNLIVLVVTAIGVVAGLVIKDEGDPRLLLILPILVGAAGIRYLEQTRAIKLIGSYIREKLWLYLRAQLAEPVTSPVPMPSWEEVVSASRDPARYVDKRVYRGYQLSAGVPFAIFFVLGNIVPVLVLPFVKFHGNERVLDRPIYWGVWALGVVLAAMYVEIYRSTRALSAELTTTFVEPK